MSFAAQTKKELTMIESEPCCEKAELSALIRMLGAVQLSNKKVILDISTENAAIARRAYSLLKKHFQVHTELLVRKKMRLKKNNVYIVRIPTMVQEILKSLHIVSEGFLFTPGINTELFQQNCCKRAYLRGAFLAVDRLIIRKAPRTIWRLRPCMRSTVRHSLISPMNFI